MSLLNYTTSVPAARTVSQITELLAKHGATQILTDYAAGAHGATPSGIAFAIETPVGLMRYRLPIDAAAVEKVLRQDRSIAPRYKSTEHAERVAWRIMKDWVEAQLAIVATKMVAFDEVMLPYMLIGDGTVYDLYLRQQLALGPGER